MTVVRVLFTAAFALPALLTLLSGCAGLITIPRDVDPAKAYSMLVDNWKNPDFIIIDVRTNHEYEEVHIPGAVNIDMNSGDFRKEIDHLDRRKIYLLYCRVGFRSNQVWETMNDMGFRNVAHISGGITAWQKAGFRTISGPVSGR